MGLPARKQGASPRGARRADSRLRLVPLAGKSPHRAASASAEAARASLFAFVAVCLGMLAVLGLARVALSAKVAEASIDAVRLSKSIKDERVVTDRLEIDKSLLVTPSRIESVAAGSMQMTKAGTVWYLDLPAGIGTPAAKGANEAAAGPAVGQALADIVEAAVEVTKKEARDLLVGDVGLAASQ